MVYVLLLNFLCDLRSTTTMVMLSLLPFWRASFDKYSAAAWAAWSGESPLLWADDEASAFFLCHSSIRLRAASHTSSLDITSQRPSLARIRHSSSFARATIVTSGTGIIYGFRYRSPTNRPTTHHFYFFSFSNQSTVHHKRTSTYLALTAINSRKQAGWWPIFSRSCHMYLVLAKF